MSAPVVTTGPAGSGPQGWAPGFYDKDDRYYVPKKDVDIAQHPSVNLRAQQPMQGMSVYDQGEIGSCVANANAMAFWYELRRAQDSGIENSGPSRYFIYWNALKGDVTDGFESGTELKDSGTWNRHAVKILHKLGGCTDDTFPYVPTRESLNISSGDEYAKWFEEHVKQAPSTNAYDEAGKHKIQAYYRLDPDRYIDTSVASRSTEEMNAVGEVLLDNLKRCLQDGHPVVFAFRYYWHDIPFDQSEAIWAIPDIWNGPQKIVDAHHTDPNGDFGGHAVIAIGYDDSKSSILVQNSWGIQLPNSSFQSAGGLFWMPYEWVKDFAATNDFWTHRLTGDDEFLTTDQMDQKVKQKMADMAGGK